MPVRLGLIIVLVFAVAAATAACGGDNQGDGGSATPTRSAAASRVSTTPSPSAGVDQKTPGPAQTPGGSELTPGPTETPPTVATSGRRAPRIEDVTAFFAQFTNPPQDERQCVYNPGTGIIDCSVRGLYAPDPPPTGQGIECYFMTTDGNPAAARCEIASPQGTAYFDVR